MPGEPAYPVLAVCPPSALPANTTPLLVGSFDQGQHNGRQPSFTMPTSTMATEDSGVDESPPIGFLLKWEMPKPDQTEHTFVGAEGGLVSGNSGDTDEALLVTGGESGGAQATEGEQSSRRYYGRGGHVRGFGKVGTRSPCLRYTVGLEA